MLLLELLLIIDGFNLIIALEVTLSGSIIILGRDGVQRDLAGLRGSYKIIEQTDKARKAISSLFGFWQTKNTSRLKSNMLGLHLEVLNFEERAA
ncbi:DUF5616 domain-containing protein [Desulfitobacterium dichloroeliminans]|uniref:DUF5616 domain-containing protein n=1 Tax=Desulfitobacterium dichloroeliminans TaxID=233055 RepID=UPI0002E58183|nr:DUF5616 domain-containing protein [Desulfitobacterium dichloroeliminans]